MKVILSFLFILLSICLFSQDTTHYFIIYNGKNIIQKEFRNGSKCIKIIYEYDCNGILIRRFWYNQNGQLIGVSFD